MAFNQFDSKHFNPEVFDRYTESIPRVKQNKLLENGILRKRSDLAAMMKAQTGVHYITVPMLGMLSGEPQNYDGHTDVVPTKTDTYTQSMIVVGRMKGWTEQDFTEDVTGTDFWGSIARQTAPYWDDVDQATMISILKGIFSMTGNDGFAAKHTTDLTGEAEGKVDAVTLNNVIQKAAGDNKSVYTMAIVHSQVATNLENLNAIERLKYTDGQGIQRDLGLSTWNGRLLMIDDSVPVEEDATLGKKYTSYLLGEGAFTFVNCGAKHPSEMERDARTKGGVDTLIMRQRKIFAPYGISYTQQTQNSPTTAQLENGSNWALVNNGQSAKAYINHKAIPIAQIVSLG